MMKATVFLLLIVISLLASQSEILNQRSEDIELAMRRQQQIFVDYQIELLRWRDNAISRHACVDIQIPPLVPRVASTNAIRRSNAGLFFNEFAGNTLLLAGVPAIFMCALPWFLSSGRSWYRPKHSRILTVLLYGGCIIICFMAVGVGYNAVMSQL